MIEQLLEYNREFVKSGAYEKFQTSKYPDKKIAILTCMDTRLVELLPAALGIRNGDVKMIKNAGGMITGPFDSAVRSLLVGIVELGVEEVMVIGHTDCGVAHINADMMIRHLIQRGVSQDHIDMMRYCGIDFEEWLRGFDCVESSVAETVDLLRNHPLMPKDVLIKGYVINTKTGELTAQETKIKHGKERHGAFAPCLSVSKSFFSPLSKFSELKKALKTVNLNSAGHPSWVSRAHPSFPFQKVHHSIGNLGHGAFAPCLSLTKSGKMTGNA